MEPRDDEAYLAWLEREGLADVKEALSDELNEFEKLDQNQTQTHENEKTDTLIGTLWTYFFSLMDTDTFAGRLLRLIIFSIVAIWLWGAVVVVSDLLFSVDF